MATFEVDKKTLVPFSKIVMEYLGTNNMIEVNRHVMNYYKTCKDKSDEKNTSMFMNYVINCDAYVQNSRRIFNQGCEDLRLTKLSQTRMDQLYGEYVVPRLGVKVHPISRDAVIDFLKRTPEFAADTRDIVYTLAQSHYREMNVDRDAIPKHVIDAVIERHETSPDAVWSVVTEVCDVSTWIYQTVAQEVVMVPDEKESKEPDFSHLETSPCENSTSHIINSIHTRYRERSGSDAPEPLIRRTLDCLANIGKLVDILCDFEHPSSNDQVLADTSRRLIVVFETIYERPITVHEFLKWAPRLRDASTASMSATLRESMEHFNTAMNTVDRIHKQYLGAIDDRYLMIGKYINRIDHSSCYEEIINNILEDQYQGKQGVYESCMKTLITKIYQNTYDNEPRPTDVHYFFHHAKTQKLHLESGELHGVITDKKTETDRFITSMQAVFQNVLCRDPDHLEIVEYLIYYRNDVEKEIFDVNLSDEKVANELYASLEFNDVLRNEIQRQFLEITKKPPLPSLIYKCMQQILLSEDTKRNYKPFIKDYITNLELQ